VVVISTVAYHQSRPDIIVGVLTSQVAKANTPMDYVLTDWSTTGLRQRSAFRSFLATYLQVQPNALGVVQQEIGRGLSTVSHAPLLCRKRQGVSLNRPRVHKK
jgi:hypothetical protein